ncbi:MAG: hypothetical protein WCK46_01375 [Candidatus Adlerbacteria bacterium]
MSGIILLAIILLLLFFFFRSRSTVGTPSTGFFGIGGNVSTTQTAGDSTATGQGGNLSLQRVFKIADGPVAGATFVQTFSPTTTLARYVMQDTGHIFDLAIDVAGAAARPISNTTIPGVTAAFWEKKGGATILQYVDASVLKSVYAEFPPATTTSVVTPVRIQFLPSGISALAASPDGSSFAYTLQTSRGVDGYIANPDGTNSKKVFSLPLSQVLLSWPAQNTLLAQAKSAVGVPGIAFAIDAKTGAVSPLLYTPGLSVIANSDFSKVVYQTSPNTQTGATTYAHDGPTGKDTDISKTPLPEKCAWSTVDTTALYCAVSLDPTPATYMDLWHQGLVQMPDSIVLFDTNNGAGVVITLPGNGGPSAPIDQLGVSPDGKYLLFITRGDHSLWGVRL